RRGAGFGPRGLERGGELSRWAGQGDRFGARRRIGVVAGCGRGPVGVCAHGAAQRVAVVAARGAEPAVDRWARAPGRGDGGDGAACALSWVVGYAAEGAR